MYFTVQIIEGGCLLRHVQGSGNTNCNIYRKNLLFGVLLPLLVTTHLPHSHADCRCCSILRCKLHSSSLANLGERIRSRSTCARLQGTCLPPGHRSLLFPMRHHESRRSLPSLLESPLATLAETNATECNVLECHLAAWRVCRLVDYFSRRQIMSWAGHCTARRIVL